MKYKFLKFICNHFVIIIWLILFISFVIGFNLILGFPYIVFSILGFVAVSSLLYNLFYWTIYNLTTKFEIYIYKKYKIEEYDKSVLFKKSLDKIRKDQLSTLIDKRQYGEINHYLISNIKEINKKNNYPIRR